MILSRRLDNRNKTSTVAYSKDAKTRVQMEIRCRF